MFRNDGCGVRRLEFVFTRLQWSHGITDTMSVADASACVTSANAEVHGHAC
ncbi:hypothetical protein EGYY_10830 [Eggerthella sp. YY7918]|nr:hypothetical protein EGYY_10830 [Eggerthella sp. YY7918]